MQRQGNERSEGPAVEPPAKSVQRGEAAAHREDRVPLRDIQRERERRVVKALIWLAAAILLIIFITTNSQPVKVNFIFFTAHPRLIWVMLSCAVIGGILGYLIGKPGKQLRLHRKTDQPAPPPNP